MKKLILIITAALAMSCTPEEPVYSYSTETDYPFQNEDFPYISTIKEQTFVNDVLVSTVERENAFNHFAGTITWIDSKDDFEMFVTIKQTLNNYWVVKGKDTMLIKIAPDKRAVGIYHKTKNFEPVESDTFTYYCR